MHGANILLDCYSIFFLVDDVVNSLNSTEEKEVHNIANNSKNIGLSNDHICLFLHKQLF